MIFPLKKRQATTADWEIAFMRTSATDLGIRINDGFGIEVYEASDDPTDYATIDVADIAKWTQLYNSDTEWNLYQLNIQMPHKICFF